MRSLSLKQVVEATGGTLEPAAAARISDVTIDSRKTRPGSLFIALPGTRTDGHCFLSEARDRGAAAAMVISGDARVGSFREEDAGYPLIMVEDTLEATGELARYLREKMELRVIGITGTTGKTCTKDYLVSALKSSRRVAATKGSYNNELGVPLTVFGVRKSDEFLVAELGARHPGDIEALAGMVRPQIGVITNIGAGHLELFGSLETVARTKAELADSLPEDGTLFLNADDRWTDWIAGRSTCRVLTFGLGEGSDYRAADVEIDAMGRPSFTLKGPGVETRVRLRNAGGQQVINALAAGAVAHHCGLEAGAVADGLSGARISRWRMEVRPAAGGYTVINDSYNANPQSTRAALENLKIIGSGRRTIAVLGGMEELGTESESYHSRIGETFSELDLDIMITVGRAARACAVAAEARGHPRGSVFRCESAEQAEGILAELVETGDVVLVKASRVYGLERVAESLMENEHTGKEC